MSLLSHSPTLQTGRAAIMYASTRGYLQTVKVLLSHEVDLNLQDEVNMTVQICSLFAIESLSGSCDNVCIPCTQFSADIGGMDGSDGCQLQGSC